MTTTVMYNIIFLQNKDWQFSITKSVLNNKHFTQHSKVQLYCNSVVKELTTKTF